MFRDGVRAAMGFACFLNAAIDVPYIYNAFRQGIYPIRGVHGCERRSLVIFTGFGKFIRRQERGVNAGLILDVRRFANECLVSIENHAVVFLQRNMTNRATHHREMSDTMSYESEHPKNWKLDSA